MSKIKFSAKKGLTIGELLIASSIAIVVIGGAFALWFMTQDSWINERTKSKILQELEISVERLKREVKISDSGKMFFHVNNGTYDAISFPAALDDGRSDTGYNPSLDGDGFIEPDSSTADPTTGVTKIYWDKTVIYHIFTVGGKDELRRTEFYPRDNSLSATNRQTQIDNVVSTGAGSDDSVPNHANWQNTRTIFKAKEVSLEVMPRLREFDGYNSGTIKTEDLIDFGSIILSGGYHTIKFKVIDKNTQSSDYAFGVDLFKLTPSGSVREGENYKDLIHPNASAGIDSSSGDGATNVNMYNSPDGLWSADYYMDYGADAADDYIKLNFHYDRWYETTFWDGRAENLAVEFDNTNGKGGVSGSKEWMLRLEGSGKVWEAKEQTQDQVTQNVILAADAGDITYRNIIDANYTEANGMMLSVKFAAGSSAPLHVKSAYIIQRDGASASPDDGSTAMPSIPITFSGCGIDPRNAGQSGVPGSVSGTDVIIPAGCYAWSNWIQLNNGADDLNFDKTKDYFISLCVPDMASECSMSCWQDTTSAPADHSYTRSGQYDSVAVWGGTGTPQALICGIEQIDVTYVDKGAFTSRIFDTSMDDPEYDTLKWTAVINNPDSSLKIKARSSDSYVALAADLDWSTIPGQEFTISTDTGSVALSGIGEGRYCQFSADFEASPSGTSASHITDDSDDSYAGDEDYDLSCVLKDVSIYWPGETRMVDVGAHFTKKPNYGIISVEIDDQKLTKGFVIKLAIEEDLTTGATIRRSVSAEMEPRNTGK